MAYHVTIQKRAMKALENIDEPNYSNIRQALYMLADNPRPEGCKKLKGRPVSEFGLPITGSSTKYLTTFF